MPRHAHLVDLTLPDFGMPTVEPTIPADTYRARLSLLAERGREANYDVFAVYGDREHFANLTYLTGFDPRFEEALLLLDLAGSNRPILMVGNEGWGYTNVSPIKTDLELVLFQSFSLMGQPRDASRPLATVLREAGVGPGKRVGVAGWKHYTLAESDTPEIWLEIPSYLADALRALAGPANVLNANALLMDASTGLRAVNEVEQLACIEFAACFSSQSVRNVLFGVAPGQTELEAAELMRLNGLPLSCHIFLGGGERATLGMVSPSLRRLRRGEPFTTAVGLWGALTCRAGFLAESAGELPGGIRDYVERLVAPYFEAIATWYEKMAIGATGETIYRAVHDRIGAPFFGVGLNPGHLIGLDEWIHSPIYAGSQERLRSGMALQVDVIPATGTDYFTTNIEDGIALADELLRDSFAQEFPEAWDRIQARRAYIQDSLGIRLAAEVLPFSNLAAHLPPFILAPGRAMRME